ncbi:MAG: hypothetical protein NC115_06430 [Bacteroidales bacterium]|nr:hypothetical protein [Bacteroides sp.]MCM1502288.1 hypothetical protein [Bacteroidales bacterium]
MITLDELLTSIKAATDNHHEAETQLKRLLKGQLTDLSMIPELYTEYRLISKKYAFHNDERSDNKKQFLFIILALYCPDTLFGASLNKEFRKCIAQTFGRKSATLIYEIRKLSCSWYETYPGFKGETNIAYMEITKFIDNKNLFDHEDF